MTNVPSGVSSREEELHKVLAAYYEAAERGDELDWRILLERHPEIAAELGDYFTVQDKLRRLAAPHRAAVSHIVGGQNSSDQCQPNPTEYLFGEPASDTSATHERVDFGDYELQGVIARGGMGVVFRARQRSLNRLVALKVIRDGASASTEDARRFRNEAEAVAHLDHPHVVPIYEVGEERGCSFFSMKLVEGGNLAERLNEYHGAPQAAARLMAIVARAVHHAHERGILHRDLKPSNILIDDGGQLLVADFGLARRVEGDSELTQTGAVLGTPAYMAPEQTSGLKGTVTTAADIHGLGAILYAILAGRPPFRGETPLETLEQVRECVPEPPSAVRQAVDRDLETICLKCLEKEPRRRYPSALAVAEDLERWLAGRSILARPVGRAEQIWRLCRRNPRMSVMAATVAMLLAVSVVGLTLGTQARQSAARSHREATRSGRALRAEQYARDVKEAFHFCEDNLPNRAREFLERHRPAAGEEDLRGFAWHYVDRLCHAGQPPLLGHRGEVYDAKFSQDGKTLATAGQDRTARLWDVATGQIRRVYEGKDAHTDELNWVSISPDGRTLATASDDKTVKIWDAQTGQVLATLAGHAVPVVAAIFSLDGRQVISCGRTGRVIVWDTATFREIRSFPVTNPDLQSMAISPDGSALAIAGQGTVIRSLVTGWELARLERQRDQARCAVFSHDGQVVATCGRGGEVELWETGTWRRKSVFQTNDSELRSVAFSPDDQTLAAVGVLGLIHMISQATGARESISSGHDRLWCVAYSPDGRTLATTSGQSTVKLWDLERDRARISIPIPTASISDAAFSEDGSGITVTDESGRVWICDAQGGTPSALNPVMAGYPICRAVLSRDSRLLATAGDSGAISLWELPGGRRLVNYAIPSAPDSLLAISASGQWVARSNHHDSVFLWNAAHGGEPKTFEGSNGDAMLFSPREDSLSTWGWGAESPTLWDIPTGQPRRATESRHRDIIGSQAFTPDGSILATGGNHGTIILWNPETMKFMAQISGPTTAVSSIAFSPDGRTLAAGYDDRCVRLWDVATGRDVATLQGHSGLVTQVRFSHDGLTLATCAEASDGRSELFLWTAAPRE